jgi:biofilm PGA synthesis N-glycosyltransferase PgaC
MGGDIAADMVVTALLDFSFYYPLFMAYLWMTGGVFYYFHWERREQRRHDQPPLLPEYPPVSVILPCHNEAEHVAISIDYLLQQDYPNLEIIAVNDGSTDNTAEILNASAMHHERLRVVHLATNQGKAMGLRTGALLSANEYLICLDGDAALDRHAVSWIMHHFVSGPRVAAVTGNPRIRNRSTLLGKLQVGEFSSIIGLIKRAQRVYGRIFTVSGVVAGFRKSALHRVGYWSVDMVAEDIDISWKLQLDHWDIRYEPNALCWILMPETLHGLWRQRLRWAQGGSEALLKYFRNLFAWRKRWMWPIYLELTVSILWSYVMAGIFVLWLLGQFFNLPALLYVPSILPGWTGSVLAMTCLLQWAISLAIDAGYEARSGRYYFWMVWYPIVYWIINVCTTVVALPRAIVKRRGERAIWVSPDRGLTLK